MSLNRTLAGLIDTAGDVKSASLDNVSAGLTVYATLNDLPTTGLTSGDQAYVSATSRFYISNGSGWYNVALVNATPALTVDPTGTIILAQDGSTSSVITLTGTDSDYPDANLTYSVESDGNFGGLATISQDSSVFTITPLSEDSATTSSATLTFKASDGISFGSASRSFSLSFVTQNSSKTMSLIKADTSFNDNQVDASSNSYTITEVGNVTSTALSPYHPGGYSTYFDGGTSTRITLPSDAGFAFGTGAYTVEAWVYISTSTTGAVIFDAGVANGSFSFLVEGGQLKLSKYGTGVQISSSAGAVNTNQWHHCAIVRTSNGANDTRLYVDGVLVGTGTDANNWTVTTTPSIGGANLANYTLNGYLRDLRVVKGTTVYTSAFTAPTAPLTAITNTELLTCHLPYIADGSTNSHTITVNGNTSTKRFAPYDYLPYTRTDHGGSVYMDGNGDYMNVAGSNLYSLGSVSGQPFTIEFWFNYTALGSSGNGLITKGSAGSTGAGNILTMDISPATGYIGCTLDGAYSGYEIISNTLLKANNWYHIALVKNASNLYTLYINGAADGTYSATGTISTVSNFYIGTNYYSAGASARSPQGYFSDVRVVSDAVYTSAFTPPTEPLTAITNTELLTCTNKNDIIDVAGGSIITKTGQTTTSDTERKWSTISSTYHQGSADYYSFTLPQPLGNDFTVEMWVNHTSWSDNVGIWDFSGAYGLGAFGSRLKWWDQGNPPEYTIHENSEMDALAGTWWHFALCRTGGNSYKAFINGSLEGSWTLSGGISQTIRIGNDQYGKDLLGYVQDVRVTNGLARYTAAFTPPTAEFDG